MLRETAFTKINLALHIRGRRDDGYHDLDTIFAFLDQGDSLAAELSDELSLEIDGEFAAGLDNGRHNLVIRAAEMVREKYSVTAGAKLMLHKNLPIASGVGGGSADAAAAARLVNRLWNINAAPQEMEALLAPLGADIPACVRSVTVRGAGTGTQLLPISGPKVAAKSVLLVNPRKPVPTGPIFAAWEGQDGGAVKGGSADEMMLSGRNDLQAAAIKYCPEIADILNELQKFDPVVARMSGSGATCFAVFPDGVTRDLAMRALVRTHSHWWFMSGTIR
ncbi:4-(cytidine 5'-diphospho)-2-C-methyl-D-erythritol kinase [Sphingorhabdus arenilitoris]|uniref:4-diphosphocytidyl-2-C-methyl-D-erythritol kinase n=1 Tax=Sphingorhabdus arenilitoris TaxID=1490041 RepID=A0ABV8RHK8_9SPHN